MIGERIINLRKKNGLTQLQLAKKLNISDKAVSKWESNRGDPSLEMLVALSNLFGCTIDYLVKGDNFEVLEDVKSSKNKKEYVEDLFDKALELIKARVEPIEYELWIKTIKPSKIKDSKLILLAQSFSERKIIEDRFYDIVFDAVYMLDKSISEICFFVENWESNDPLFKDAVRLAIKMGDISISKVQRAFGLGYPRAAKLVDDMEVQGFISPLDEHRQRHILIDEVKFKEVFSENL